jgi:predicted NBD/HSP70 family sugar kinase
VERARELAPRVAESGEVDLDTLVEAFQAGDAVANEVVIDAAEHLGRAIGALIGVLNVEHIVLVGEMTRFGEPWLSAVRREARRSALALLADTAQIEIGRLSPNLVVLGSAALLMTRELGLTFSH